MNTAGHLTEDQLDDALIGDLAADCAAHLAGCETCRVRLAEAEAPLASFNEVSLAWSERRSATLPRPTSVLSASWLPRARWAALAAAAAVTIVMVPVLHHSDEKKEVSANHGSSPSVLMASTGPVESPVTEREEQIARDNELLAAIDLELSAPPVSYGSDTGLPLSGHTHNSHQPAAILHN